MADECIARLACYFDNLYGNAIVVCLRHEVGAALAVKWYFASQRGQIWRRLAKQILLLFPFRRLLGWRQRREKAVQQLV